MSKKVSGSEVSGGDGDGGTRVVSCTCTRRREDVEPVAAGGCCWSGVTAMAASNGINVGRACGRHWVRIGLTQISRLCEVDKGVAGSVVALLGC